MPVWIIIAMAASTEVVRTGSRSARVGLAGADRVVSVQELVLVPVRDPVVYAAVLEFSSSLRRRRGGGEPRLRGR
jgi:hypothetical protein